MINICDKDENKVNCCSIVVKKIYFHAYQVFINFSFNIPFVNIYFFVKNNVNTV